MSVQTLFSKAFLLATLERAIRSFAASLASLLTAAGTGLLDTSWFEKLSVAGMAALVTILFAIAGGTLGKGDGPSFIGEERLKGEPAAAPAIPAQRTTTENVPAAPEPTAAPIGSRY
jgi:hypothetical protein